MVSPLEKRARQIAAHKMGLVKDARGEKLPDDLWKQAIPAAEREAMSPLEKAILDLPKTGWTLMGLGKSPFDSVKPWSCDLVPMHLGTYYHGKRIQTGSYSAYQNAMARITGSGETALAAIQDAKTKLDKHPAKAVYEELNRAFEDLLDEHSKST